MRALGIKLNLSRWRVEGMVRVSDGGDLQRRHCGVSGGGMVEDRVEHPLVVLPGKKVVEAQSLGQLLENPDRGARLSRRIENTRHQVEMGVRALATDFLEP